MGAGRSTSGSSTSCKAAWPGLVSLRLPSLVFLCLALPAVALVARELVGDEGAAAVVLLFAVSPIPVLYATFGRPHTMLFAWLMWSTVPALRAARSGSRRWWIVAGAALGLSVFVHPTAPLYALTTFAAALVYAPRPPRIVAREAWPGAVALLVTFVPYYVLTLHVLSDRYGVGTAKPGSRTFSGRPVWEDALHFVAPGKHDLNFFTAFAAVGVLVLALRRRGRALAFCAVIVAAPILFFSFVPANGDSALFFDRYMIPAIPAFLVVVVAALLAVARLTGVFKLLALAGLVAALMTIEVHQVDRLRRGERGIGLDAVARAVQQGPAAVLFGSTGTSGANFSSFDYGHPANLLGHYISLEIARSTTSRTIPASGLCRFSRGCRRQGSGCGSSTRRPPTRRGAASAAFATARRVEVLRVGSGFFIVRSAEPETPRTLIALGRRLRLLWRGAVPLNRRVNELLQADRQLLARPLRSARPTAISATRASRRTGRRLRRAISRKRV